MNNWIRKDGSKGELPCQILVFNNDLKHRIEILGGCYGCYMQYFFDDKLVSKQYYRGMSMAESKKMAVYDVKMMISEKHNYWQKLKVLTDLEFKGE
jgi:hypothetical protein